MQAKNQKQNKSTKYSSSEESDESVKDKKVNKLGKSEKNKIVRNIFLSKGDGGAKGKGQVMIVGHSDDTQKSATNASRESYHGTNANNTANGNTNSTVNSRFAASLPIVCKIDLARLTRIPNDRTINHVNNNNKSPFTGGMHLSVSIRASKHLS